MGQDVSEYLKEWKIKDIDAVIRKTKVLRTKIRLELVEVNKKSDVKAAYNFYRDLARLEQALKRNIDQEKTTVLYWIELNKLAKQLSK